MTQRAIVLAAGMGSRLAAYTGAPSAGAPQPGETGDADTLPKPLKPVRSVPLIVRILRTLQSEGVREAVIIVGYRSQQLRDALVREPSLALRLHFVENPHYERKNGVSLLAAKDFIGQGCLLTMSDHLYSPELVRRVRAYDLPSDASLLAVDHDIERCFDLDDATKVWVEQGRVRRIGKELDSYNALDTGVFRIGPSLVAELERVYAERGDCSLSDGVSALSRAGRMHVCGIGDARWIDVDTPEAARHAEAMLQVFGDDLGDEPADAPVRPADAIDQFALSWVRAAQAYNDDHLQLAAERTEVARLMANESPYPPSEHVVSAIVAAAVQGNRYPLREPELCAKLAEREGVAADQVLLGAGSSELIDLAIRTFVAPGEEVLLSAPTFSMYEARTRTVGGIPVHVPLGEDHTLDVRALVAAITERTKLVFLCTPNNPTGLRLGEAELRRVLELGLPTVVDEAYHEFGVALPGALSAAALVSELPNLLVLRTFSKAYGLAGLRLGYALGHAALVRLLTRVKVPWNVSSLAVAAAAAALDEQELLGTRVAELARERSFIAEELGATPGLEVVPGEANFVLVDATGTGLLGETLVQGLLQRGILVRSLRSHRAGRHLVRVTVGASDDNRRCVRAFREVLAAARADGPASVRTV
ncbi:MAG: histidinol-phosphate transaminase [Myxococcales bacterium]|nr:histidinol-phosphate transaminase [Myxococcales bacterium]